MNNKRKWCWLLIALVCGVPGVLGIILCGLFFLVGTLFFDDPNASYGQFILRLAMYLTIPLFLVAVAIYFLYKYIQVRKKT
ncbi:hypothetical protein H8B09_29750 [Paenibacillus sp. PR3]|uniref:Uncharacterized protein n=1 Tax=Paenibacillus terricola TaxID=2763503 RepID=A0ABR8N434_9BACL|nr:hypothetical protein [Paenibacillus terricola]MBD3922929.1 hypothetical protein [Paenibacillus terricola]